MACTIYFPHIRATSPVNRSSSEGENGFLPKKTGRSQAVYELIRKIPTTAMAKISVPLQPLIRFPRQWPMAVFGALGAHNGTTIF